MNSEAHKICNFWQLENSMIPTDWMNVFALANWTNLSNFHRSSIPTENEKLETYLLNSKLPLSWNILLVPVFPSNLSSPWVANYLADHQSKVKSKFVPLLKIWIWYSEFPMPLLQIESNDIEYQLTEFIGIPFILSSISRDSVCNKLWKLLYESRDHRSP